MQRDVDDAPPVQRAEAPEEEEEETAQGTFVQRDAAPAEEEKEEEPAADVHRSEEVAEGGGLEAAALSRLSHATTHPKLFRSPVRRILQRQQLETTRHREPTS